MELYFNDPVAQIKLILANKKYSSAVLVTSSYEPNGP